jgi:hypothetical protein
MAGDDGDVELALRSVLIVIGFLATVVVSIPMLMMLF